ncbi:hypothetical protein GGX14DRAFT_394804 [Mycena pura]|uniref:Uncharacterized protein n=1 Tax=Mycena pura TaxID=153505 RepID=A0AAD6VDT6_9AGAR|nr:hypothetical protein GGX14DRAFT_394804 [Mycena pura]
MCSCCEPTAIEGLLGKFEDLLTGTRQLCTGDGGRLCDCPTPYFDRLFTACHPSPRKFTGFGLQNPTDHVTDFQKFIWRNHWQPANTSAVLLSSAELSRLRLPTTGRVKVLAALRELRTTNPTLHTALTQDKPAEDSTELRHRKERQILWRLFSSGASAKKRSPWEEHYSKIVFLSFCGPGKQGLHSPDVTVTEPNSFISRASVTRHVNKWSKYYSNVPQLFLEALCQREIVYVFIPENSGGNGEERKQGDGKFRPIERFDIGERLGGIEDRLDNIEDELRLQPMRLTALRNTHQEKPPLLNWH